MSQTQAWPTHRVEMGTKAGGLYESYYFRGTLRDGSGAFWLKHNLLRFNDSTDVLVENTLVLFSENKSPLIFSKKEICAEIKCSDWDEFTYQFKDGSRFSIASESLSGVIYSDLESISWNFSITRSNESYYHFSHPWFYRGFFPKKKILTRDISVGFKGEINCSARHLSGEFVGMNGHNWGREHAPLYLYANCNEWSDQKNAYFDGLSAKIRLAGVLTPFLSLCSLKIDSDWFHFNSVVSSWSHDVKTATPRAWRAVFDGLDHRLLVDINGEHASWVGLTYAHPNRKTSLIENTKTANGVLTLVKKSGEKTIAQLRSARFELETLFPQ